MNLLLTVLAILWTMMMVAAGMNLEEQSHNRFKRGAAARAMLFVWFVQLVLIMGVAYT